MNFNFSLPTADKIFDALFGNIFGFIILIIVIAAFVGVIIYKQMTSSV